MNYTKIISELNTELYDHFEGTPYVYSFQTNDYVDCILFGDKIFWDSENNEMFYPEEKGAKKMKKFLKKELKRYAKELKKYANIPTI